MALSRPAVCRAFLPALLLVAGCATGPKFDGLVSGMSVGEVTEKVGFPDAIERAREAGAEAYIYQNRLRSDWWDDKSDYYVVFKNGQLVEKGQGVFVDRSPLVTAKRYPSP